MADHTRGGLDAHDNHVPLAGTGEDYFQIVLFLKYNRNFFLLLFQMFYLASTDRVKVAWLEPASFLFFDKLNFETKVNVLYAKGPLKLFSNGRK